MERSIDVDKYITINKEVSYSATSKIKCSILENKRIILKKYNNKKDKRYYKEKKNYLLLNDCYFIPKLIYYDDNNKILLFEDAGDSLKKIVIHNEYHVLPAYSNIIIQLHLMILQLYSKYKLVHNDITFRNICIKNGKLYLTVPFGKKQYFKNYIQFDNNEIKKIIKIFKPKKYFIEYYKFDISEKKWKKTSSDKCKNTKARSKGNLGISSNSVALIEFQK